MVFRMDYNNSVIPASRTCVIWYYNIVTLKITVRKTVSKCLVDYNNSVIWFIALLYDCNRNIWIKLIYLLSDMFFLYCLLSGQDLCWLPFTWYPLYVDWLHYLLWELRYCNWWMWLLGRCWWSGVTIIICYGFDCARTFYSDRYLLQRTSGYNGWTKDLAAALSYTGKKDANESEQISFM